MSDNDDKNELDENDPHRALDINLEDDEDFLAPSKPKKVEKKLVEPAKVNDEPNLMISTEDVVKKEKKKHKRKKEENLLEVEQPEKPVKDKKSKKKSKDDEKPKKHKKSSKNRENIEETLTK